MDLNSSVDNIQSMDKNTQLKVFLLIVFIILLLMSIFYYVNLDINIRQKSSLHRFVKNLRFIDAITLVRIVCILIIIIIIILYLVSIFNKHKKNKNKQNANSNNNVEYLTFNNQQVQEKYDSLVNHIGLQTQTEKDNNNNVISATWMSSLDNYQKGLYSGNTCSYSQKGLDYIKLNSNIGRKYHPIPADMYVIAGKYMNVPDVLLGPIKYASETINVEQLQVPKLLNNNFGKSVKHGNKGKVLVTGSCASVTISALTVDFVENMINKFNKNEFANLSLAELHDLFRIEYDNALLKYLCEGKEPNIKWFNPLDFGEPASIQQIPGCNSVIEYNGKLSEMNQKKVRFDLNNKVENFY